jgi:hypothetical protein
VRGRDGKNSRAISSIHRNCPGVRKKEKNEKVKKFREICSVAAKGETPTPQVTRIITSCCLGACILYTIGK